MTLVLGISHGEPGDTGADRDQEGQECSHGEPGIGGRSEEPGRPCAVLADCPTEAAPVAGTAATRPPVVAERVWRCLYVAKTRPQMSVLKEQVGICC